MPPSHDVVSRGAAHLDRSYPLPAADASVIVSASGIAEATAKGSSASPNFGFASQWGGMALVGLVGGLVGALVVL